MLIVAMLAQTTTAVPAQRLLFPQHWLLVGWDMVSRRWDALGALLVASGSTTKGLPTRSSTLDGEELPAVYTTEEAGARAKSWQTPRTS